MSEKRAALVSLNNAGVCVSGKWLVRGVSLDVSRGEIVTLIGSNGAGKSTLLMTISGVNKASTGEILFDDQHIENLPPHEIVNLGISQSDCIARKVLVSLLLNNYLQNHL